MKKNERNIFDAINVLIGILANGDLDEILAAVSEILRRPVVLFNPNLQMISMADHAGDRSPLMDSITESCYHPDFYALAPQLVRGNVLVRDDAKKIHAFTGKKCAGGEVFAPIMADNTTHEILGYLYFYEPCENALRDNQNYLSFICHSLSWRMWKYTHTIEKSNALLTDILCNVLDGAFTDDILIRKTLDRAKVRSLGYRMLFVISSATSKLVGSENPTQKWSDLFKNIWLDTIAFMYNGDLILIILADYPDDFDRKILPELRKRLPEIHCFAGYSEIFERLDHYLLNYYVRSLAAVQTAVFHDGGCIPYENIALEHILRFGKIATSRAVVDPRLLKMLEADQTYSTNYAETLRIYWASNKDVKSVCEKLHIQRSTFFYRLNKIRGFLGEGFQNHKQYLQYNVSLSILEKLGELPPLDR